MSLSWMGHPNGVGEEKKETHGSPPAVHGSVNLESRGHDTVIAIGANLKKMASEALADVFSRGRASKSEIPVRENGSLPPSQGGSDGGDP